MLAFLGMKAETDVPELQCHLANPEPKAEIRSRLVAEVKTWINKTSGQTVMGISSVDNNARGPV